MVVTLISRWKSFSSSRAVWRTLASRFDSGSSMSSTFGRRTSARAMATRWRSPPEICEGMRSSRWPMPSSPAAHSAFFRISSFGIFSTASGKEMLPKTDLWDRGIALEHHGDAALARRQVVHLRAVDDDAPARRALEPGDEPHERRLAAARRPQERQELAVLDLQIDAVDRLHAAKVLLMPMSCTFAMMRTTGQGQGRGRGTSSASTLTSPCSS